MGILNYMPGDIEIIFQNIFDTVNAIFIFLFRHTQDSDIETPGLALEVIYFRFEGCDTLTRT